MKRADYIAQFVPRWRQAWQMRRQGARHQDIAKHFQISEPQAARLTYQYQSYLLNQQHVPTTPNH